LETISDIDRNGHTSMKLQDILP